VTRAEIFSSLLLLDAEPPKCAGTSGNNNNTKTITITKNKAKTVTKTNNNSKNNKNNKLYILNQGFQPRGLFIH
jgi:hypothetical protein